MLFTLTANPDSLTGSEDEDNFTTSNTNFNAADTLIGGNRVDVLAFTNRASIVSDLLVNKTGIDAISFSAAGNTLVLSDAFVDASDVDKVELRNSSFTITSLDTSAVNAARTVVVAGTGAVTLANNTDNRVVAKDGVNTLITGGTGNDTLLGGTGSDRLTGNTGNDVISGGGGNDSMNGGSGDDTIATADAQLSSQDTIVGGAGTDTLLFTDKASISTTDLNNMSGVEVVKFSADGNNVALSNSHVILAGGSLQLDNGAFTITSLDTSLVRSPYEVVIGGTGAVTLANAANRVSVKDGVNSSITGGTGNDTITGGSGNDYLVGGRGNDSINAGAGDDTVSTMELNINGADHLSGGTGTDTLRYLDQASVSATDLMNVNGFEIIQFTTNGNTISLSDAVVASAGGTLLLDNQGFTITSLSSAALQSSHMVMIAGTGAVTLADNIHNQVATKDGVNASVIGGSGNDTIMAGSGNNALAGGAGNDMISTSSANIDSNDTIDGGAGTDTLYISDAAMLIADDFAHITNIEQITFSVNGNNVTLDDRSIELNNQGLTISRLDSSAVLEANTVVIGGTGAVTLADGVNNRVTAKDGVNSSIIGGSGNDTITSGTGNNLFNGGAGDDTFINIKAGDTVVGGDGMDSLIFTAGATISNETLAHVSGIEKIYVSTDITNLMLSEAFVDSAYNETVELYNGSYNVFRLDSSAVHSAVVISGTGPVTLNDNTGNQITSQDGVNTNITGGTGNDTFISGTGNDSLSGSAGDDSFLHITADDTVNGGEGSDRLVFDTTANVTVGLLANVTSVEVLEFNADGNQVEVNDAFVSRSDSGALELVNGTHTITSLHIAAVTSAHDVIVGGTGAVTLADNTGNRVVAKDGVNSSITGGSGNDTIIGGTGNDSVAGGAGSDSISGGAGDDVIRGLEAGDTISGGTGTDTLVFDSATDVTAIALANVSGIDVLRFNADGNSAVLIDSLLASSDNGVLELDNTTHSITSLDTSAVSGNYSVTIGGTGAVTLADNAGNQITAKDGVNSSITGGTGNDTFVSGSGDDAFDGGAGDDSFSAITAGDTIVGGAGNDTLLFTTATTLTSTSFAHISGIETIRLDTVGSLIALTDSAVSSSDTGMMEIANGANATTLDTSGVTSSHDVLIGGTGAVTLADNAGNRIVAKDGVNTLVMGGSGNDSFLGGAGSDNFSGNAGDDSFSNIAAGDTVAGGEGRDTLSFSATVTDSAVFAHISGVEVIALAADGNILVLDDTLVASAANGTVEVANGAHTITSLDTSGVASGHNVEIGGTGAVTLADNAGNQVTAKTGVDVSILGGSGDDSFVNVDSGDTIDGGAGVDTLRFTTSATINDATFANITNVEAFALEADGNTLTLTDNILATLNVTDLEINNGNHTVTSLSTSSVSAASDIIIGGTGAVTLASNTGNRIVTKDGVNTSVIGGSGDDLIINGTGSDALSGGDGEDTIVGLNAGDTISGGESRDTLVLHGTFAADAFANVTGIDILEFLTDGNSLVLADSFVSGSDAGSVELRNSIYSLSLDASAVSRDYEVLLAGEGVVTLADNAGNRIVASDDINAAIIGGSGNDTIIGGAGWDTLTGGSGNDSIVAASGNDTILTSDAELSSGDTINGGSGMDTLQFTDVASIGLTDLKNVRNVEKIGFSADGNNVALADANVSNAGGTLVLANGTHTITSLDTSHVGSARHVEIGGTGAVTLAGNAGNRVFADEGVNVSIAGGSGNDTIIGSTGDDSIAGGVGVDILTGDTGADSFIFTARADSGDAGVDRITDFVQGEDVIVLAGLGFTGIQAGSASGTVLGFTDNGASTTIADATSAFIITLHGVYTALTASDFVFA